ncbi:nitrate/nitrite transporter NrtS [Salinivibrio socompensis]|uniref:nitrate/nitrite transporter NrtS n=1 Tax=Salinivibrio socompensis TaxID=1510206 RepID=UPI00047138B2|nr:nitrate/nitrite transporter NrtS [Salinivibrio socompensis]
MSLFQALIQPSVMINALKIALVVGTVLNLINQGEAFWGEANVRIGHALLNYLVPYCVASYSAAKHQLDKQK